MNSPEVVKGFCALVFNPQTINFVMDVVATAAYSEYVNSCVSKFGATHQRLEPICFAHAAAAVFVLATDSTESFPTFETVKNYEIPRTNTFEHLFERLFSDWHRCIV